MSTVTSWQVGELADAAGLSADAIRYYERAGLLPAPPRSAGGYRLYGPEALDRLRFIRGCQRLGMRLREIRDLLAVRDAGTCPCEPAEPLLRRHISDIDTEIARLTDLRRELTAMLDAMPAACAEPTPDWWCPPHDQGGDS